MIKANFFKFLIAFQKKLYFEFSGQNCDNYLVFFKNFLFLKKVALFFCLTVAVAPSNLETVVIVTVLMT